MKAKTVFFCSECGNETAKWAGKCPACGAWNSLVETPVEGKNKSVAARASGSGLTRQKPLPISKLGTEEEIRFSTGIGELDRVLGGGAVRGSMVLVGGAPGIGKSTLLLQMCGLLDKSEKILYVSGEESQRQIKMRAMRMGVDSDAVYVLSETDIDAVTETVGQIHPDVLIIDSVQTMFNADLSSAPGSVGQVKDCAMTIMRLAKAEGITAFVVGHVNKEGAIAGPKVLEHMVDCVLYFEGDESLSYRIIRAAKNRFGSTNELGVFEMLDSGLREVENPSEMLLSGRPDNSPGTCVACVMSGSRPILAEVQALVSPSNFSSGRRNTNGVDYNRVMLLIAVLEKRGGLAIGGCDNYINVIGGLQLSETAADLATVLALASSFRDRPIGNDVAAIGEVGLTGELRSVNFVNQRLAEVARLGFKRCVIPAHIRGEVRVPDGLELIHASNVRDAIEALL